MRSYCSDFIHGKILYFRGELKNILFQDTPRYLLQQALHIPCRVYDRISIEILDSIRDPLQEADYT